MITGSLKRVDIDSITYDVVADSEPVKKPASEIETKATSGAPILNITKMVGQFESVTLGLSADQHKTLEDIAKSTSLVPIAITNADGKVWSDNGKVVVGDYNSKASTADVMLIPGTGEFTLI